MFVQEIPDELHALATVVLCVLMFSAVTTDIRQHRITNHLVIFVLIAGLFAQLLLDLEYGLIFWGGGIAVGLAIFLPFYIGGGMGAGDVKLMAAVGSFLGPLEGTIACASALVAGLPLALGYYLYDKAQAKEFEEKEQEWHPRKSYGTAPEVKHHLSKHEPKKTGITVGEGRKKRIPYAAAIAVGTAVGLWWAGRFDQAVGVLLP